MSRRLIASFLCLTFNFSNLQYSQAQDFSINQLPVPGTMLGASMSFVPLSLKGLVVNPRTPLEFQFIIDTGKGPQDDSYIKAETNKLIKYFLAGLTIPDGDLWVNLSPYEKERIITPILGQTHLGRDLLAQDYILKQLTASFIYPEKGLGKEFWRRIYKEAQGKFGTTNIPVNTFNKVWIIPGQAQVFENGHAVYVTKSTLKVMLDQDYLAKKKHQASRASNFSSQVIREIVLPQIENEINRGKNFAPLRQIYDAIILAKWYKESIQNGLLDAVYTNKKKILGLGLKDQTIKEQIYNRYLMAYKKGVFNYIKEEAAPDGQKIPRKYFSGGEDLRRTVVQANGSENSISWDGAMKAVDVNLAVPRPDFLKGLVRLGATTAGTILAHPLLGQLFGGSLTEALEVPHQTLNHFQMELLERLKSNAQGVSNNAFYDLTGIKPEGYRMPIVRVTLKSINAIPVLVESLNYKLKENVSLSVRLLLMEFLYNLFTYEDLHDKRLDKYVRNLLDLFYSRAWILSLSEGLEYVLNHPGIGIPENQKQYLRLLYAVNRENGYHWMNTDAVLEDYEVKKDGQPLEGKIHSVFTDPKIQNLIKAMDTWDGGFLNRTLPLLLPAVPVDNPSTWANRVITDLVTDLKTAEFALQSTKVQEAIQAGRFRLYKTATLHFRWSEQQGTRTLSGESYTPRTIELPQVTVNGSVLNEGNHDLDPRDPAMNAAVLKSRNLHQGRAKPVGGIDFNQINVHRSGKIIKMQFDPQQLNDLVQNGFAGFTPEIIKITPISNPFQLLGIASAPKEIPANYFILLNSKESHV